MGCLPAAMEEAAEEAVGSGRVDMACLLERRNEEEKVVLRACEAADAAAGLEDGEELPAIEAAPAQAVTFAPQLELVDGKLVPKAQSLTVQAQAEPTHRRVREYNNIVNNASYTNRMPNERWSAEETDAFFNVSFSISRCTVASPLVSSITPAKLSKTSTMAACLFVSYADCRSMLPIAFCDASRATTHGQGA